MASHNTRYLLKRLIIFQYYVENLREDGVNAKGRFRRDGFFQERKEKGEFHLLVKDIKLFDHSFFLKYFEMNPSIYEKLLSWVGAFLKKQETHIGRIGIF